MFAQIGFEFQWFSTLGLSVILFGLYGLLSFVVGIGMYFVFRKVDVLPDGILYFSREMDSQLFDRPTSELVEGENALATLRFLYTNWLGGVLLSFGIFQLMVVWFGLREGQVWALITLTIADLALLPYLMRTIRLYHRRGVRLQIAKLPPLYTLLVLIPIAALLGWLGLQ